MPFTPATDVISKNKATTGFQSASDVIIANQQKPQEPTPSLTDKFKSALGTAEDYAKEAVAHPLETAKGVVKGIPGQAAELTKGIESIGKAVLPNIGTSKTETAGLDYKPVEELTSPSNKAQTVGYYGSALLPVERALPIAKEGTQLVGKGVEAVAGKVGEVSAARQVGKLTNSFDEIANLISPKVTPTSAEELVTKKAGGIMGINQHDIIDYSSNPQITKAVDAVKDIIKPSETAGQNKNLVLNKISDISENEVKPFLKENPVPFNFQDLRDSFNNVHPQSALKADTNAYANYNRVKEDLLNTIAGKIKSITNGPQNLTDMNELWDARKLVDKKINEELNMNLGDAQYAGAKAAAQDFRQQFAKFIDNSLHYPGQMDKVNKAEEIANHMASIGQPVEDKVALYDQLGIASKMKDDARLATFRNAMDKMTSMYHAVDGLSTKVKADLGKSTLSRVVETVKKHPVAALGATGYGAYQLGKQ